MNDTDFFSLPLSLSKLRQGEPLELFWNWLQGPSWGFWETSCVFRGAFFGVPRAPNHTPPLPPSPLQEPARPWLRTAPASGSWRWPSGRGPGWAGAPGCCRHSPRGAGGRPWSRPSWTGGPWRYARPSFRGGERENNERERERERIRICRTCRHVCSSLLANLRGVHHYLSCLKLRTKMVMSKTSAITNCWSSSWISNKQWIKIIRCGEKNLLFSHGDRAHAGHHLVPLVEAHPGHDHLGGGGGDHVGHLAQDVAAAGRGRRPRRRICGL